MKAIIFDCDGVLVDSESIYQDGHAKFLTEMGLSVGHDDYARLYMGLPTPIYFEALQERYTPVLGHAIPDSFITNLKSYCQERIKNSLVAIDGAEGFVKSLDVPYAVASSTKLEFLHKKLHQTNLHSLFVPHIYSGEQVPKGKPFPDLFLHTAKMLNVDPRDCVVVEDSVNGVKAGVAAGMHVIGFCGGGHCGEWHHNILINAGAKQAVATFDALAMMLAL